MAHVRVYCGLASANPPQQLAVGSPSLCATVVDDAGRLVDLCDIGDDPYGYAYLSTLLAERASGPYSVAIAADSDQRLVPALLTTAGWPLAFVDNESTDDFAERFVDELLDDEAGPRQRRALGLARALQAGTLSATSSAAPMALAGLKPVLAAHGALAAGRHATAVALREVLRELYPAALRAYPDPADPVALAVMDALPEPGALSSVSGRGRDAAAAADAVTARLAAAGVADPAAVSEAITALRVAIAETPRRGGVQKGLTAVVAEAVRQSVATVRACDAACAVLVKALAEQVGRSAAAAQPATAAPPGAGTSAATGAHSLLPGTAPPAPSHAATAHAPPPHAAPQHAAPPPAPARASVAVPGRRVAPAHAAPLPPQPTSPAAPPPVSPSPISPPPVPRQAAPLPPPPPPATESQPVTQQIPAVVNQSPPAQAPPPLLPPQPMESQHPPPPQMPPQQMPPPQMAPQQMAPQQMAPQQMAPPAAPVPLASPSPAPHPVNPPPVAPPPMAPPPMAPPPTVPPPAPPPADHLTMGRGTMPGRPVSAPPPPPPGITPISDPRTAIPGQREGERLPYRGMREGPPPGSRADWPTRPAEPPSPAPEPARSSGSAVTPPWQDEELRPPEPPVLRLVEPALPDELRDDLPYQSDRSEPPPLRLVEPSGNGVPRNDLPRRGSSYGDPNFRDPPYRDSFSGNGLSGSGLSDNGLSGNGLSGDGAFGDGAYDERAYGGIPHSVPPVSADDDETLLIFAQTRSAWFTGDNDEATWGSALDRGWQAAEQASRQPAVGDRTDAGLPRRVPSANLLPGSPPTDRDRPLRVIRDPASIAAHTSGYFNGWRRGQETGGYPLGGRQQAPGAWDFTRDDERLTG